MAEENVTTTESTTPTAPTEAASSTTESSAAPSLPPTESPAPQQGAVVQPQTPAFAPTYKVKAFDQEHDIPELFRPLIKDEMTQKQIKEVFEKAYGMDGYKSRYENTWNEFSGFKKQTEPLLKIAQELDYYSKKGDMGSYFKTLGLTDEQIMQYALQKAQQMELSPEQKRVYDERENAVRQQYMLETQFQQAQEQLQNLMVQQRNVELQSVLSRPEIQSFVQNFDRRNGQGSFAEECRQRGRAHFALTGEDLSAEQVAQDLIKKFEFAVQAQQPQMPPSQPKAPAEVPVIPNTGSGAASPAQKQFKSLEDLKRYKQERWG